MAFVSIKAPIATRAGQLLAAWLLLFSGSESHGMSRPRHGQEPLLGSWGGRHVGLIAGPSGAKLEYDCASGEIEGPIRIVALAALRRAATTYQGMEVRNDRAMCHLDGPPIIRVAYAGGP